MFSTAISLLFEFPATLVTVVVEGGPARLGATAAATTADIGGAAI